VNDISPDIALQQSRDPRLSMTTSAGTDFQYLGMNLRDPVLAHVEVRQAISCAIDRAAIVTYLRRDLATPAAGVLPPVSWAAVSGLPACSQDPEQARRLLDAAGFPDPDGAGPASRFRLVLEVSNIEFNRLQSTVIQNDLRAVGIDLDVRMYEFATLYADVVAGRFQMFSLQWTGGALADPDILRLIFHSSQVPPAGFNRGFFADAEVDALLDEASRTLDEGRRRMLYDAVQRRIALLVAYIPLWHKTNFVVAQRSLTGVRIDPAASLLFLAGVARRS
jgi:peptide/nickel transport system substrate-binding protein